MKSFTRIVLTAITLLLSVSFAAAQAPSGLQNKLDVQKLVTAGTPEAHATLARHFTALANGYAADAARHKDMAAAYAGNPNRSVVTNTAPHCARLADLATEEATAAREMASYHEKLVGGAHATAPKDAAAFQGGKGAPEPTKADLHHLAIMARTAADHHVL